MQLPHERIILPLDVSTEGEALVLVEQLKDYVGIFKIGLELFNFMGPTILKKVKELGGKVFYDSKFKDIPNTIAGAARGATNWGVQMFNVHADGGIEMMRAALEASRQEAHNINMESPKILGVTVLTSLDKDTMNKDLGIPGEVKDTVARLARMIDQSGLDGIIASGHEIEIIQKVVSRKMLIVTPGIRPAWAAAHDQKRIMTPSEAILRGASYLVIGRPITHPPKEIGNQVEAAKRISEEIAMALEKKRR